MSNGLRPCPMLGADNTDIDQEARPEAEKADQHE